jgi:hypothetical protein
VSLPGEAVDTSLDSKRRLVLLGILIISPDMRQSFLFSSSTVFRFSIHSGSIGPSNISHFLSAQNSGLELRMRRHRMWKKL